MLWIKAFHIIFVVTWFAGLLYLPRLFVYHTQATDQISRDRFTVMERKLYKFIMTPSLLGVFIFGLTLIGYNLQYFLSSGWFHLKLLLWFILFLYHLQCGRYVRKLAKDQPVPSPRFFRFFNEVPSVLLIVIVILVEVQPQW